MQSSECVHTFATVCVCPPTENSWFGILDEKLRLVQNSCSENF